MAGEGLVGKCIAWMLSKLPSNTLLDAAARAETREATRRGAVTTITAGASTPVERSWLAKRMIGMAKGVGYLGITAVKNPLKTIAVIGAATEVVDQVGADGKLTEFMADKVIDTVNAPKPISGAELAQREVDGRVRKMEEVANVRANEAEKIAAAKPNSSENEALLREGTREKRVINSKALEDAALKDKKIPNEPTSDGFIDITTGNGGVVLQGHGPKGGYDALKIVAKDGITFPKGSIVKLNDAVLATCDADTCTTIPLDPKKVNDATAKGGTGQITVEKDTKRLASTRVFKSDLSSK